MGHNSNLQQILLTYESEPVTPVGLFRPSKELQLFTSTDYTSFPSDVYKLEVIPVIDDIFLSWSFRININLSRFAHFFFFCLPFVFLVHFFQSNALPFALLSKLDIIL